MSTKRSGSLFSRETFAKLIPTKSDPTPATSVSVPATPEKPIRKSRKSSVKAAATVEDKFDENDEQFVPNYRISEPVFVNRSAHSKVPHGGVPVLLLQKYNSSDTSSQETASVQQMTPSTSVGSTSVSGNLPQKTESASSIISAAPKKSKLMFSEDPSKLLELQKAASEAPKKKPSRSARAKSMFFSQSSPRSDEIVSIVEAAEQKKAEPSSIMSPKKKVHSRQLSAHQASMLFANVRFAGRVSDARQRNAVFSSQSKFIKHGRTGTPKLRDIQVDPVSGTISWGDSRKTLKVHDLEEVLDGKKSNIFQKPAAETAEAELCFSLVFPDRTLDLEALSIRQKDLWIEAIIQLKLEKAMISFDPALEENQS